MHCSYCGEPDHNKSGCKYLKAGLPPPSANSRGNVAAPDEGNGAPSVPPTSPDASHQDDPVLNQVIKSCSSSKPNALSS